MTRPSGLRCIVTGPCPASRRAAGRGAVPTQKNNPAGDQFGLVGGAKWMMMKNLICATNRGLIRAAARGWRIS